MCIAGRVTNEYESEKRVEDEDEDETRHEFEER